MKAKHIFLLLALLPSLLVRSQSTVLLNACSSSPSLSCGSNTLTIHNATVTPGSVIGVYFHATVAAPESAHLQVSATNTGFRTLFISSPVSGSLTAICPSYSMVTHSTLSLYYNQLLPGTSTVQITPTLTFSPGVYVIYAEFYKPAGDTNTYYHFNVNMQGCTDLCPQVLSFEFDDGATKMGPVCADRVGSVIFSPQIDTNTITIDWNYGDGVLDTVRKEALLNLINHNYPGTGTYTMSANIHGPGTCATSYSTIVNINCEAQTCKDCIESFSPLPAGNYILSGWVKENGAGVGVTTYTNAQIVVNYYAALTPTGTPLTASPKGLIIDGWQKIEESFTIPSGATSIEIVLTPNSQIAFYDDIRVFPFDGSMKSYVYDSQTMRLVAELDERNYATMYEYDEEGKLIRVKKETERGIMTIKESRNSAPIK